MEKEWHWKSFVLNQEFQIAAGFIYDGLRIFDQMRFFNEEYFFGFLYNISIGIERLEKSLVSKALECKKRGGRVRKLRFQNTKISPKLNKNTPTHPIGNR